MPQPWPCRFQFAFDFLSFYYFEGIDLRYDGGLTLALAFWSRSAVLLQLNRGADALVDIQCAIDNGLEPIKAKPEYFARLAKGNARKLKSAAIFSFIRSFVLFSICLMRCTLRLFVLVSESVWQVNKEKHFSREHRRSTRIARLDCFVVVVAVAVVDAFHLRICTYFPRRMNFECVALKTRYLFGKTSLTLSLVLSVLFRFFVVQFS